MEVALKEVRMWGNQAIDKPKVILVIWHSISHIPFACTQPW